MIWIYQYLPCTKFYMLYAVKIERYFILDLCLATLSFVSVFRHKTETSKVKKLRTQCWYIIEVFVQTLLNSVKLKKIPNWFFMVRTGFYSLSF